MDWKDRAVEATRGTQFIGAIIACALGRVVFAPYFLTGKASVMSDGRIRCDLTRANGERHISAPVGTLDDLETSAASLGKLLKLSLEERAEYVEMLVNWIGVDYCGAAWPRVM